MVEEWFKDDTPSTSFPIYTRGNAGEVFPDPVSPIAADYTWTGPGDAAMKEWLDGYTIELHELDPGQKALFEVFGGHMYMNLSVARLMGARTPGMTAADMDAAYFGTDNSLPPHVPRPLDDDPAIRQRCADKMTWFLTRTEIPEVDEQQREVDAMVAARPDLTAQPEAALVARMREMKPWFHRIFVTHAMVSSGAGMTMGALTGLAAAFGRPGLDLDVSSGLGGVDSAEPSFRLWHMGRLVAGSAALTAAFDAGLDGLENRLAAVDSAEATAFRAALAGFQARFGARGPNEWEPRSATWGTDTGLVLTLLDRIRLTSDSDDPRARHATTAARSRQAIEEFRQLVSVSEEAAGTFELALTSTNAFMPARERSKDTIVKVIHEVRLAALELGRRLAADGRLHDPRHVFMLADADLDTAVAGPTLADDAARREANYLALGERQPPFVFVGDPGPVTSWARKDAAPAVAQASPGDVLTGLGGSTGIATGRARIVLDPSDPEGLEPGDILIAPITDPSWTPLFLSAAGVVVDTGGTVSHAVIVSRELGIPCAVSVTGASDAIPDGATVTVDGAAGTVTIVSVRSGHAQGS